MKTLQNSLKALIIAITLLASFPNNSFATDDIQAEITAYLQAKGYTVVSLLKYMGDGQWMVDTQNTYHTIVYTYNNQEIITHRDQGVTATIPGTLLTQPIVVTVDMPM